MERLSETIARQAIDTVDRDPDHSLLLALAAFEECATALAHRAKINIEDLVANAHHRVSRNLSAGERRNLMLPPTGD
jgi:hypothetical protein